MKHTTDHTHKWSFFKAGGFYQANIESGSDIANIGSLDRTLWAALSCPTSGVHFDQKTLELLDDNGDGRIRSPEIVKACEWVCGLLKDPDRLVESPAALRIGDIDDSSPEGALLCASAEQVAENLGKNPDEGLRPEDFDDETRIFSHSVFNADGVVTEDAAESEAAKAAMRTIMRTMGASADRSGKDGVSEASVREFYERLNAYEAWKAKGGGETMPFGADTEAMYAALSAVQPKIDEYFELSRIISYDDASAGSVNPAPAKFAEILASENPAEGLAKLPLATVRPGCLLDLDADINPAWIAQFAKFKDSVALKIFPEAESLSEDSWATIKSRFAPYSAWLSQRDDKGISAIPADELANAANPSARAEIEALIAKDWSLRDEVENISKLARLVRLNTHLYALLTNFVNFKAFYKRNGKAMFQAGRLFFDQRECDLCIRVGDAARHATLSPMSYIYLVYCTCRRDGEAPMEIAAAITEGDADNIQVGRNGLFFDRDGRDWDATVTKIVSNPISIRQAFWSPYKRMLAWVSEQIAKRATAADTDAMGRLTSGLESAESAAKDPKAPKKIDIGTVAALGVAVGGITAAFGVVVNALMEIAPWKYPIIIVAGMLLISLPSMIIAAMKLRQRNLGPLLDANNWAVNTRAKLNFKLGATLTRPAKIPLGSRADKDPFEEKKPRWKIFLAAILLGAAAIGGIEYKYSPIRGALGDKEDAQSRQGNATGAEKAPEDSAKK